MPDIFVSPSVSKSSVNTKAEIKKSNLVFVPKSKTKLLDHAFSPFLFMPEGIRFDTQEPDETIILFLKKHWVTNFVWIASSLILIATPILIFPGIYLAGLIPKNMPSSFLSLIILIWYLFVFTYSLINFLLWYFTVSIVTTERIIDIDFINILQKKFAATRITRIEDVTMRRGGILKAVFDFGDVLVQTAAKDAKFQFYSVPFPERVVRIINNLMGQDEEEH